MNDAENNLAKGPGEVGIVDWKDFTSFEEFTFVSGEKIPQLTLRYETYGHLHRDKDNVILICHALSGDHHCAGVHSLKDRKPGWWNNLIGPGKAVDTDRFFVICSNCLGGCVGSTGPSSINPSTGQRYGCSFPLLTIADMVKAQHLLLTRHLGIEKLYAAIGGSMGGMQVLQWAVDYPEMVERIIPMATTTRQNAQAIAFNEVGRLAIVKDKDWQEGNYLPGKGPHVGLAVARMMAHITYLSDVGLEEKFGRARLGQPSAGGNFAEAEFEVESYLRHQGQSFIHRFDANTYLYFTKALDRFDLAAPTGRLEDTLAKVKARTLSIAFTSDWLFPPAQNRQLVHALLRCGKEASYAELRSTLGHDSFLVHDPSLYSLVSAFLS